MQCKKEKCYMEELLEAGLLGALCLSLNCVTTYADAQRPLRASPSNTTDRNSGPRRSIVGVMARLAESSCGVTMNLATPELSASHCAPTRCCAPQCLSNQMLEMAHKRTETAENLAKLRQFEVPVKRGFPRVDAICEVRVTQQTYYRRRR